jgi:hypothetical protein
MASCLLDMSSPGYWMTSTMKPYLEQRRGQLTKRGGDYLKTWEDRLRNLQRFRAKGPSVPARGLLSELSGVAN